MTLNRIIWLLILLFIIPSPLFAQYYEIGDVVEELTWRDSNIDGNGEVVVFNRTLTGMVDDSNKVVIFNFASDG